MSSLCERVEELLGAASKQAATGISLDNFLRQYANEKSEKFFLDDRGEFPKCKSCGANSYVVVFSHKPQMPPEIEGQVLCSDCGALIKLEVE